MQAPLDRFEPFLFLVVVFSVERVRNVFLAHVQRERHAVYSARELIEDEIELHQMPIPNCGIRSQPKLRQAIILYVWSYYLSGVPTKSKKKKR